MKVKKIYLFAALLGVAFGLINTGSAFKKPESRKIAVAKTAPGGFQVSLSTKAMLPIKAQTPFTLKANIKMFNGQGRFEFIWWLPEEVNVVSGVVDPTLYFNTNGEAETEITLTLPRDDKNYQIDGEAYRIYEDGSVLGSIKQFNTNPELLESATIKPALKKERIVQ